MSMKRVMTCPPKIGPPEMRDSCKITTGGNINENKKVFGGAGQRGLKELKAVVSRGTEF